MKKVTSIVGLMLIGACGTQQKTEDNYEYVYEYSVEQCKTDLEIVLGSFDHVSRWNVALREQLSACESKTSNQVTRRKGRSTRTITIVKEDPTKEQEIADLQERINELEARLEECDQEENNDQEEKVKKPDPQPDHGKDNEQGHQE